MEQKDFTSMGKKAVIIFFLWLIALGVLAQGSLLGADNPHWIKSTVNGNFYSLTPSRPWTDAEAWAQEWEGHLVTLRSWSEEKWIKETFGRNQFFWIGYNVIGREHSEENFYWSSGEPVTYTNWAPHEPSNTGGVENVTAMNDAPHLSDPFGDFWNDLNYDASHQGVVEIVTGDELGLVLETSGEVSITGNAPTTKQGDGTKKGDLIRIGDLIKTHINSLLIAAFPAAQGFRNIEIHPESEVRIAEASSSSETTLEFFMGKIQSKIEGLPEGYYFEVTTAQAVCGVRGTEFIVEGDETYTKITVLEGSVEVTTLDGTQSVMVQEDYAVQATDDGLGEPYPVESEPEYFAGGSGTETDPWQIETAEHLDYVRHFLGEEHQDKHFRQTADIDLGISPWNEGEGWVPIGTNDNRFYGHFDGNGKEIANLYINRDTNAYQGLFGWNNGVIANVVVLDASVTDHGSRVGILAGLNDSGLIENCSVSGIIQTDHEDGRIGGLTGWNSSTIKGCSSTAIIVSKGVCAGGITGINSVGSIINCFAGGEVKSEAIQAGGLVGTNQAGGLITGCYATGKTTGSNYVGGLVGSNLGENSTIEQSYSTGDVFGNNYVGGLAGIQTNNCRIVNSHSLGTVHATGNWTGGLVGVSSNQAVISESFSYSDVYAEGSSAGGLCGTIESNSTIQNVYASGSVSGLHLTGGLAGWADSSQIINAYSTSHVLSEYGMNAGGLTGGGSETDIVHSYWNTETSGQITNEGGEGKNTGDMLSQATFTNWDFDTIWDIKEGETYPYLIWQEEPEGFNYPEEVPSLIRVPSMFPTIQEGIDKAGQGNTVLVADGVYTGRGNLFLSFKGKDIVLRSENGPEQCIIDYHEGQDERAVFLFMHGETRESVIEGFTLMNGPVAVYIENASPTIRNNVVTNNASGILCGTGGSPLILNNSIIQNSGTGIVCVNASPEIKRNLISENGAGRFSSVMTTTFDRHQRPDKTYITGRTEHGGISAQNMSSPNIQNNLILYNRGMDSGAIYADSTSAATIVNNHIMENASINGGSVFVEHPSSTIVNNLIAYAGSSESTAGLSRWYKDPLFMHFVYDGAKLDYVSYYFGFVNYGEPCEVSLSGCAGLGGRVWAETGERFWVTVRSEVDQFGHGGGLDATVQSDAGNFSITQRIGQFSGGCNRVSSTDITSFGISEGRAGAGITVAGHIDLPLIAHNNMFGNSGANYAYGSSGDEKAVAFDLTGTDGNISQDPHLDPVTFELLAGSPCIDAGIMEVAGVDLDDVDFLGHARIRDGHGDGHAVVDIGAFEYQRTSIVYTITASTGENGSISPAGETEVEHGNKLVLTITPDEGFRIAFIIIDGAEIDLASDPNWDAGSDQYTFTDITEAHTIEVGFEVATSFAEAEALQRLTVYPNPAKDELWVAFDHQGDAEVDLVLLNIHGQVVQQVSVSASGSVRRRMSTHDLTPGVYLLTIRGGEVFPVKKVVIEN